ncbi:hypothetical protein CBS9595_001416 [Malassezia furfur]|nr:hypothetical protein CBS9595_001416 [Malassezia furfur]
MGSDNRAHVRLQTLLNVSATHLRHGDDQERSAKRMRISSRPAPSVPSVEKRTERAPAPQEPTATVDEPQAADDSDDEAASDIADAFHTHFGAESADLAGIDTRDIHWTAPEHVSVLGGASVVRAVRPKQNDAAARAKYGPVSTAHREWIDLVGRYVDVWDARVALDEHDGLRSVLSMHAMSHVARTRQRILKDNERLAKAAVAAKADGHDDELPELRDQGFTRPKVLLLVPFRNTAKAWVQRLINVSGCDQVEHKSRFQTEFSLPPNAVDKLADPQFASHYPADHRKTFAGNIDDNFKLGVKLTRKTLKLYSAFFESDVIVASPLGLRLLIEKEHESDYLSSIEMVLVDQMDVMLMQNWDHVKFVLERLNAIPKQAHDTDFSRVKPWYLDDQAKNLRQSILLSSFDAPEFRTLFHHLQNVAGRVRTVAAVTAEDATIASVVPGVRQTFQRFECANAQGEADARFHLFVQKTLPHLERSAVSATHTMIVIPSYFDFVRVEDHFRKAGTLTYATLSEYSSNKDVSRARQSFFAGKKSFLLVTERFHFYRRYMLRGARTIVFYAPPEHASYYPELINAALSQRSDDDEVPDPSEIGVQVLYCKYDLLRLERLVGSAQARRMVTDARASWRFT